MVSAPVFGIGASAAGGVLVSERAAEVSEPSCGALRLHAASDAAARASARVGIGRMEMGTSMCPGRTVRRVDRVLDECVTLPDSCRDDRSECRLPQGPEGRR